eukprot:gene10844-7510_t
MHLSDAGDMCGKKVLVQVVLETTTVFHRHLTQPTARTTDPTRWTESFDTRHRGVSHRQRKAAPMCTRCTNYIIQSTRGILDDLIALRLLNPSNPPLAVYIVTAKCLSLLVTFNLSLFSSFSLRKVVCSIVIYGIGESAFSFSPNPNILSALSKATTYPSMGGVDFPLHGPITLIVTEEAVVQKR